jgi:hypothetical protein
MCSVKQRRESLIYEEPGRKFFINAPQGDGYTLIVESMGECDPGLDILSIAEKLRIARNIKSLLLKKGKQVEIICDHHLVVD